MFVLCDLGCESGVGHCSVLSFVGEIDELPVAYAIRLTIDKIDSHFWPKASVMIYNAICIWSKIILHSNFAFTSTRNTSKTRRTIGVRKASSFLQMDAVANLRSNCNSTHEPRRLCRTESANLHLTSLDS